LKACDAGCLIREKTDEEIKRIKDEVKRLKVGKIDTNEGRRTQRQEALLALKYVLMKSIFYLHGERL
jgi:hypothetical protein